jgi:DNA replication protein DnaC
MDEKSVQCIQNLASRSGEPAGLATQQDVAARSDQPENNLICPICDGTGWINVGPKQEKRVARCNCFLENRAQRLIKLANIPARHEESEFSNYKTGSSNVLAAAKGSAQNWADQYPLDRTGFLFSGPSGVGKTHLSVAIIKQLMKKGVSCLFCDYRDLLKQIQNSYNPSVQTTELELLRPVFKAEVLILDDLGAVKPTQWVWDSVSIVLNTRYNDDRTTIITTNFEDGPAKSLGGSPAQSAAREETLGDRIGERMRSRLFEMCRLVRIDGKDFREKFRSAGFR